nr:protein MENT isoform X2 [Marmota flaviventris]
MVPAACVLFWALLLSLGLQAAGAQDQTPTTTPTGTGTKGVTLSFGSPARSRNTGGISQSSVARKTKIVLEDENDAVATADHLAGPAAAELLATVTGMRGSSETGFGDDDDGSLEEGVVIDARKNNTSMEGRTIDPMTISTSTWRVTANKQEKEIRMTTSLPPAAGLRSTGELSTEAMSRWSTAGSTPSGWPSTSRTAMPPPEDLRLVLMPWGPWHCHCKSGTMSRTRSGKLQGISGRLRVGALRQIRTEHRPCTYQKCPCNRLREECPLDSDLCSDNSCTTQTTTTTTTTTTAPIQTRRLTLPPPPPSPGLVFWKKVRMGLEDIWNSLSSVFTEMQPTHRNRR